MTKTAGKVVFVEDGTLPSEYRKLTGIVFDGGEWYDTGFCLQGSDTVKIAFKISRACNIFGCYTTTSATNNYSLYVSVSGSSKYMRYGNGTYNSVFSTNTRYDVTVTPTGTDGFKNDSTWSELTFTAPVTMLIGSTSTGATSAKLTGTVYGNVEVVGKGLFVPAERISDGAIGYYDLLTEKFIENEGTGTPEALGYAD